MTRHQNTNLHSPPLKIACWNAAGIKRKLADLTSFIGRYNIDIMIVTETHTVSTDRINIKGYHVYTGNHDWNCRRGGAVIYVKTSIRHISINIDTPYKIQCSTISVTLHNGECLNIAAAYLQPQDCWTTREFHELLCKFGERFLVLGDWNAKSYWWGNARSCARGAALLRCVHSHNYNILATGSPTHYPTNTRNSPSAIDFGVYRGLDREQLKITSTHDLSSDHLPLLIEVFSSPQLNKSKCYLLPLNASINKFKSFLCNHILLDTEINSPEDIDDCVQVFERNVKLAASYATPPQTVRSTFLTRIDRPTLELIKDRRLVKKIINLKLNTSTPIKRLYNFLTNSIKKSLKKVEERKLTRLLESLAPDNRFNMQKLWRITSSIKRQPTPNLPVRKHAASNNIDGWCKSSQEKVEAFSQHLQERFTTVITTSSADLLAIEQNTPPPSNNTDLAFRSISADEILKQIKLLKSKKSPGYDNIDNRTLRALPTIAIEYLALLFNNILKFGHYPSKWKHAVIKMIHKPGKPSDQLSSYRPISLLSGVSKIFETLILKRMYEHDSFARAIPNHQFGFRKQHGAEQQLGRVSQYILKAFENSEYCSAVYLDIKEAFDRVWHKGLFYKLNSILPPALYRIIRHYLTMRTFMVESTDGLASDTKIISAGVPQGSVLGPILYTVYASDIPSPEYPNASLIATYADDTVIMSSHFMHSDAIKRVEKYLKSYLDWANKWCVTVNVNKTAHVMHTLREIPTNPGSPSSPKFNGILLTNKTKHTYLGVKLDTKLVLQHHVLALVIKLRARIKKLHWLLNKESKLPLKTRVIVYKQLIAPIWQYSLPIWGSLVSNIQMTRIRVIQNKTLRIITGASWHVRNATLHADLKVKQVDEVFHTMSQKYIDRLLHHDNPEARKLATDPYRPIRLRLRRPRYLEMLQRCLPIQQNPAPPLNSSSNDREEEPQVNATRANAPSVLPTPCRPSLPTVPLSSRPSLLHFIETGEMDESFGDLRYQSAYIYMSARYREYHEMGIRSTNVAPLTRASSNNIPNEISSAQHQSVDDNSPTAANPGPLPSEVTISSQIITSQPITRQDTEELSNDL